MLLLPLGQVAQAAPPLWETSYNVGVNTVELNGSAGGATVGGGPSGTRLGGREAIDLGFSFPFGGNSYSSIVVDSDGSILLVNNADSAPNVVSTIWIKDNFEPKFTNYGNGQVKPVLLPFGSFTAQDLSSGQTFYNKLDGAYNGFNGDRGIVTWIGSSIAGDATADISFQAQLLDDGTIIFSYQALSAVANWNTRGTQGIVIGISDGSGETPLGSSDFSVGDTGIGLTGYQVWCRDDDPSGPADCVQAGLGKNSAFDLHDKSVVFNPDGDDAFLVSQTIEDASGQGGSGVCEIVDEDAPAAAQIWDDSYDIAATELNGTAGGKTAGGGPSGTRLGGREAIDLGFNFPFGGSNYSSIVVDSDGGIVLTNTDTEVPNVLATIWTSDKFQPEFTNYGSGSVAPVLLPFGTFTAQLFSNGNTYFKGANDTFAGHTGERAVITWKNSSLDGTSTRDITFQAHLFADGTIVFSYQTKSDISRWDTRATQGIVVGISDGSGEFPAGSQNLSTYDFGIDMTGYQVWCRNDDRNNPANCVQAGLDNNDGFDLDGRSVVFNPDGSTGFLVSSAIKDGTGKGRSDVCAEPPEPPPATAPVAVDDNITATEDLVFNSTTNLIANDFDVNGDDLRVVTGSFATAQGGTITIENNNGRYTYTPPANFNGSDHYDYTLRETKSGGLSDTGRLNISVAAVNDAPVAVNDAITATEDTLFVSNIELDANDGDVEGTALLVVPGNFATAKGGGIAIAVDGSYLYLPPENYSGADHVDYTVTDGQLGDIGRLNITVTAVNDPPEATDDQIEAIQDTPFVSTTDLDANDNDVEGTALTVVAGTFATAQGGSIVISADGSFTYTPPASFTGADHVDYTVSDGALGDTGRLNITVTGKDTLITETIVVTESVLNTVQLLEKTNSIRKHRKSKKFMRKARNHLIAAIEFLEADDIVNGAAQIDAAIADLRKVRKKKSRVRTLIEELENLGL